MQKFFQKEADENLELEQLKLFNDMDRELRDLIGLFNRYLSTYSKKLQLAHLWIKENDQAHINELIKHIKDSESLVNSEIDIYQKESFDIFKCLKDSAEEQDLARRIIKISSKLQVSDELSKEEELEKYDLVIRENLDKIQHIMQERLIEVISKQQKMALTQVDDNQKVKFEKSFWSLLQEENTILRELNSDLKKIFSEVENAVRFAKELYEESEGHVFGKLEHQLSMLRSHIAEFTKYLCQNQLLYVQSFENLRDKTATISESIENIISFESEHTKKRMEWAEKYLENISELFFEIYEKLFDERIQKDVFLDQKSAADFRNALKILNRSYAQLAQICRTFDIQINDLDYFREHFSTRTRLLEKSIQDCIKENQKNKVKLYFALQNSSIGGFQGPLSRRTIDFQAKRVRNQIAQQKAQTDLDLMFLTRLVRQNTPEGLSLDNMIQCSDSIEYIRTITQGSNAKIVEANVHPKYVMIVEANNLVKIVKILHDQIEVFIKTLWELLPSNFLAVLEMEKVELAIRFELLKHSPMVFRYIESKNILIDSKTHHSISKFLEDTKEKMIQECTDYAGKYWSYERLDQAKPDTYKMPQIMIAKALERSELRQI